MSARDVFFVQSRLKPTTEMGRSLSAFLVRQFLAKMLRCVAESRVQCIPDGIVECSDGRRFQERQICRKFRFTQRVVGKQIPERSVLRNGYQRRASECLFEVAE